MQNRKAILSTLWIFTVLNYLYCDVVGLMDSGMLSQYMSGEVNGMAMTQGFLLAAIILMEIPTGMILLSRVLPYKSNRWANIVAGVIMTVVQMGTLFAGSSTGYYLFASAIEIAATAFIVWYAWTWRQPQSDSQQDKELAAA
ncbi:MAG: DUF6326 family protein [Chloroflexota bacterium]